jgi:hypothetical protein
MTPGALAQAVAGRAHVPYAPTVAECLEVARPWPLMRTAAWGLAEAAGLPVGAYLGVSALAGPGAGIIAGLSAVWLTVLIHKLASGKVPGLLMISALMLCMQTVLVLATGQAWIYLLQFPAAKLILSVMFARSAGTSDPLVARLATEFASVRHSGVNSPGLRHFFRRNTWLWAGVFGILAAAFAGLIAAEPIAQFLIFSTIITVGVVGAAAGGSALWFGVVLRRNGLRLRFAAG